ncbi:MAG: N-acetyltransferase [Thermodesulfobacteriota bacterium]|nr:N-acetyltransferase [Thermodesulfobacteriota bacterium]
MLRKAKVSDVKVVHRMINLSSSRDEMLPRSLMDLYSSLRDFFVYLDDDDGSIIGICAMHIFWENLAEVRSLYVKKEYRRSGIGRDLVEACISEAITLDLLRIFTLTSQTEFFKSVGFTITDKSELPEKIWSDCLNCPKYPDFCDEVAMIIEP